MEKEKEILTPELIIYGKYTSVERSNSNEIRKLEWGGYADVLYSFCNILALGIYIQEKNKYKVGNDKRIRLLPDNRQWLATHKTLQELHSTNNEAIQNLIDKEIIREFAKVYNTIGNVIPIWPGGNEFKGKCFIDNVYCYDIPDIFFRKYCEIEKMYIENILKKEITEVALSRFITVTPSPNNVQSISNILEYNSLDEYLDFIKHIVDEIQTRNEELEYFLQI